jgi:hypothetical protein
MPAPLTIQRDGYMPTKEVGTQAPPAYLVRAAGLGVYIWPALIYRTHECAPKYH